MSVKVFAFAALTVWLAVSSPLGAEDEPSRDWPSFRGPSATGQASPGQAGMWPSPASLEPRWKTSIGSAYSGVSAAGSRLVTGFSADGQDWLGAFDLESGAPLWRVAFGETYVGHDGSHDGPIATPAIAGKHALGMSARGVFLAVDLESGQEVWRRDLGSVEGAQKPHYGHGSSPVVVDGLVVLALRAEGRHSVVALRLADGTEAWSMGDDTVNYQSPLVLELGGVTQVVALSDAHLWGLEPKTGAVLWSYEHQGDFQAAWGVPLPTGRDRLFLLAKRDEGELLEIARDAEGAWKVSSVWTSKALGRTYSPPVYHDGVIYGYSGSFLSAIDAGTGERLWRSRPPGDGFLAVADDRLVVVTKKGTLHLAATSREGWKEIGASQLFTGASWTPPSVAAGRIVARSIGELAVVDVRPGRDGSALVGLPELPADSPFRGFLDRLAALPAAERGVAIDGYLAEHATGGPLVEGDRMIFLYRGEGRDLGITGSMIGQRMELPMVRVEDTDLFWWATTLPRDARVDYQFIKDYEERVNDPRNSRVVPSSRPDPPSWAAMPDWKAPAWMEKEAVARGRIERHELAPLVVAADPAAAEAAETQTAAAAPDAEEEPPASRVVEVWLPPGYDEGEQRYPVAYVHMGDEAVSVGKIPDALDFAVSSGAIEPLVVVFIHRLNAASMAEFLGEEREDYIKAVVERIIPLVDTTYRTAADRAQRASVGFGFAGCPALLTALEHRELFGSASVQSPFMLTDAENAVFAAIAAEGVPLTVDLEWGSLDYRAEHEGWDARGIGRRFAEALGKGGHVVRVREVADGFGWGSWPLRAPLVFGGLFEG